MKFNFRFVTELLFKGPKIDIIHSQVKTHRSAYNIKFRFLGQAECHVEILSYEWVFSCEHLYNNLIVFLSLEYEFWFYLVLSSICIECLENASFYLKTTTSSPNGSKTFGDVPICNAMRCERTYMTKLIYIPVLWYILCVFTSHPLK